MMAVALARISRRAPDVFGHLGREVVRDGAKSVCGRHRQAQDHRGRTRRPRRLRHTDDSTAKCGRTAARAARQSASICARSASTSGNARSSRRRWTNDSRSARPVEIAVDVKRCVSITCSIDVAKRRTHADVRDRRMHDAVDVTSVAYTPDGGTSSLPVQSWPSEIRARGRGRRRASPCRR